MPRKWRPLNFTWERSLNFVEFSNGIAEFGKISPSPSTYLELASIPQQNPETGHPLLSATNPHQPRSARFIAQAQTMARNLRLDYRHQKKLDELKVQLCLRIRDKMQRYSWPPEIAARRMGTSRATISRIERLKVSELTLSQLFTYLAIIKPDFEVLIAT